MLTRPLHGADLVLLAMHSRAGASANTLLAVELDGPADPGRVATALAGFLTACPWPTARLARPFPWGGLRWEARGRGPAPVPVVRHRGRAQPLERVLEEELAEPIDPKRETLVRLSVVDAEPPAPAALVVTWFHPLMDPRGGENFLGQLARVDREGGRWSGDPARLVWEPDGRPLQERGALARRHLAYLRQVLPPRIVSPGTRAPAPGRLRVRRVRCREDGPTGAREGTRDTPWRLAVVGQALAAPCNRRGLPDLPFVVPVSVDLRPKGDAGPTFGNCLAFHFARFRPSATGDLPGLAGALRAQLVDAIRDGQVDASAAALDFLAYRPLARMLREVPWMADGESFSFNCADIGDFRGAGITLFGRRILNAFHVPAVLPRPGVGVFFNRCGEEDNVVVSWFDGVLDEAEVDQIIDAVIGGLRWRRA